MAKRSHSGLQFKITLKDTKPPVWRRIQVPGDYTFWDLHVAIQDSMGWLDSHLHLFEVYNRGKHRAEYIGIPDEEFAGGETLPGWEVPVATLFPSSDTRASYSYDFGDGWEHTIVLEKVLARDADAEYPRILAGRRRCPPEDCGDPWGYRDFLTAISDPNHEQHAEMLEWVGGTFDPDDFDPAEVVFEEPRERLRYSIGLE